MINNNRLTNLITYRKPNVSDGSMIWKMVRDSGKLDINSAYFYLTMCTWFSESCRVAMDTSKGRLAGFVIGFRQPQCPNTLFIWQIAVDQRYRGNRIASKLLDEVSEHSDIQFMEATITPSNVPSQHLFKSWAIVRQANILTSEGFSKDYFPGRDHEREELFRIGPIKDAIPKIKEEQL